VEELLDKGEATKSAYYAIRELIINREILPGEKINQISMANRLKISRTPIINALHRLESEGLVDKQQNLGFTAHRLSIQELQDLFELREALDIVVINDLVRNISDSEVDQLQKLFEGFLNTKGKIDEEEYRRTDMKFHSMLFKYCKNQMVQKVNENMQILARAYTAGLIRPHEETFKEHLGIIKALREKDSIQAEKEIRRHINLTKELIRNTVDSLKKMGLDPNTINMDELNLTHTK
jgi:DNA-binding GntR family transcriptional regulator